MATQGCFQCIPPMGAPALRRRRLRNEAGSLDGCFVPVLNCGKKLAHGVKHSFKLAIHSPSLKPQAAVDFDVLGTNSRTRAFRGEENSRHQSGLTFGQITELLNRDLSPQDYEMLLQLDEFSPQPRRPTISASSASELAPASREIFAGEMCSICLGEFEEEEDIRQLPCEHCFHSGCIREWLTAHSSQCPLCQLHVQTPQDEADVEFEAVEVDVETRALEMATAIESIAEAVEVEAGIQAVEMVEAIGQLVGESAVEARIQAMQAQMGQAMRPAILFPMAEPFQMAEAMQSMGQAMQSFVEGFEAIEVAAAIESVAASEALAAVEAIESAEHSGQEDEQDAETGAPEAQQ